MKLFVWEYSKKYETFLAFAIAEDSDSARELIADQQGFFSDHLKKPPATYDLLDLTGTRIAYVADHSG